MNRRDFLRSLLATGVVAYNLDIDKLLWVQGEKTIFLPSASQVKVFSKHYITESQIIAAELERIAPLLPTLFERDSIFFNPEIMVCEAGELLDTEINKREPSHPIIYSPFIHKGMDWSKE